jgi:excisionase family DNA binding protein
MEHYMDPILPLLMSVSDACKTIGVSRSKIYELIAAGDLTVRKLGRKSLIAREELVLFAARLPVCAKRTCAPGETAAAGEAA